MNNAKSGFIWNILGSFCNAFSSVILLMLVSRVNGPIDGGIFSIGFATAQLMETVGLYEVRTYQVTDVKNKFSFSEYHSARILSCLLMILMSILYIFISGYTFYKAIVCFLLCIYKMIDALSDVYQGLFQKEDRLDLAGKALAYRVALATVGFSIVIFTTHHLLLSVFILTLIAILVFIFFDLKYGKKFSKIKFEFNFGKIKQLFIDCFPLFLGSFMLMYIINAPKYAIDNYLTEDIQTYYNVLFMPASVINLMTLFIFRPVQISLAVAWDNARLDEFLSIIKKQILLICIFTIVVILGGYVIGIPILSIIYSINLSIYRPELIVILIGGGCNAIMTILYYILTIMRKQKSILFGYSVVWGFSLVCTPFLVKSFDITGASFAYVIQMLMMIIIFTTMVLFNAKKIKKQ